MGGSCASNGTSPPSLLRLDPFNMGEKMGMRIIKVSPAILEAMLRGEMQPASSDTPDDVRVKNVRMDSSGRVIEVLVESNQWESVDQGMQIPWFEPTFTTRFWGR